MPSLGQPVIMNVDFVFMNFYKKKMFKKKVCLQGNIKHTVGLQNQALESHCHTEINNFQIDDSKIATSQILFFTVNSIQYYTILLNFVITCTFYVPHPDP